MGDLIRIPYSELHATLEVLDRCGVKLKDFHWLGIASTWHQFTIASVIQKDEMLLGLLSIEEIEKQIGFTSKDFENLSGNEDRLRPFFAARPRCA